MSSMSAVFHTKSSNTATQQSSNREGVQPLNTHHMLSSAASVCSQKTEKINKTIPKKVVKDVTTVYFIIGIRLNLINHELHIDLSYMH